MNTPRSDRIKTGPDSGEGLKNTVLPINDGLPGMVSQGFCTRNPINLVPISNQGSILPAFDHLILPFPFQDMDNPSLKGDTRVSHSKSP
jgi:hypothetical protein